MQNYISVDSMAITEYHSTIIVGTFYLHYYNEELAF